MRPNLFFIDFNRSGDCLFVFLRYVFHGLFFLSFDYGLVSIINQETGLFQEPSFKMCAISRTLSISEMPESENTQCCNMVFVILCSGSDWICSAAFTCQVSNGIKGSNATGYAGLGLDCIGVPAI